MDGRLVEDFLRRLRVIMPTYNYKCSECGHQFELFQSMKDEPLKTCPECSRDTLDRLVFSTNFVLKGGGWFKDGYSKSSK